MEINLTSLKNRYVTTLRHIGTSLSIQTNALDELSIANALEHATFAKKRLKPCLIIVSGLSGAGKTTTLKHIHDLGYEKMRTVTTRPRRASETNDGSFYLDTDTFNEWKELGKIFYPHLRNGVQQGVYFDDIHSLSKPRAHLYTDRSVASAQKLLERSPNQNIYSLYILPPTLDDLYARLTSREESYSSAQAHTLTRKDILLRLEEEIVDMNLLTQTSYSFLVNDSQERLKDVLKETFAL